MKELLPSELRVVARLGHAEPDKIIAFRLGVTVATVKHHMKSIIRKTGLPNRTAVALWAVAERHAENAFDER